MSEMSRFTYEIREALENDIPILAHLIKQLAIYEKMRKLEVLYIDVSCKNPAQFPLVSGS